ncbi:DUF2079 domain-containing protein [Leptospira ryugenii]|uniref:DUF2079 domain-containing protein n=1 Tax=Leptospira ryugenii TaxID=1917863 RepID=UPI000D598ADE|nr:DUF2079 domain-containing protein [Leptospira ryugenii]
MKILFLFFSLSQSILFFLPEESRALFLSCLLLVAIISSIVSFRNRLSVSGSNLNFKKDRTVYLCAFLLYAIAFIYHYTQLTRTFAMNLGFHDADYIGIQETIRSLFRGEFLTSIHYSVSGQSSYLSHHFAPILVLFLPFELLDLGRYGYAIACGFYYLLGILLWILILIQREGSEQIQEQRPEKNVLVQSVLFVCLLNSIYLYRLATSFHFEVIILPLSACLFYSLNRLQQTWNRLNFVYTFIALTLCLLVKEDVGFYLSMFLLPFFASIQLEKKPYLSIQFKSPPFLFFLISISYSLFVILLVPFCFPIEDRVDWFGSLSKEYPNYLIKEISFTRASRLFFELSISVGLGFVQNVTSLLSVFIVFLTHALSKRPWHQEIYSYYSYTILPLLLSSSILWQRKVKVIPTWIGYLLVVAVFWVQQKDTNYPLPINSLNHQLFHLYGEEPKREEILWEWYSASEFLKTKPKSCVFTQYNLGFLLSGDNQLYPLEKYHNRTSLCKDRESFIIYAPKLTHNSLFPKERIESITNGTLAKTIQNGNWIIVGLSK